MMPTTSPSLSGLGTTTHGLVEGSTVMGFYRDHLEMQDPVVIGSFIGTPQEFYRVDEELDDKIIEMINTDRPVIFDCLVDKQENCFPMIPSGKPHNQMLLGPKDQEKNKITGKGKTLV